MLVEHNDVETRFRTFLALVVEDVVTLSRTTCAIDSHVHRHIISRFVEYDTKGREVKWAWLHFKLDRHYKPAHNHPNKGPEGSTPQLIVGIGNHTVLHQGTEKQEGQQELANHEKALPESLRIIQGLDVLKRDTVVREERLRIVVTD